MTQPTEPPLLVEVEKVARLAGLDPADESAAMVVEEAIRAATDDVYAYLGRFVVPTEMVESGRAPVGEGWNLCSRDVIEVLTATPEVDGEGAPTGLYTITYLAGLDARSRADLAPIRRWVTAAAQVHPAVRRLVGSGGGRERRTVSAEGQSVTYEAPPSSAAVPTAGVPLLSMLDRWRSADTLVHLRF